MNRSYLAFILGFTVALSGAGCGPHTTTSGIRYTPNGVTVPNGHNGTTGAPAQLPLDGDWTVDASSTQCSSGPTNWLKAQYNLHLNSGVFEVFYPGVGTAPENYKVVPFSVAYSQVTPSGGTITLSGFRAPHCGTKGTTIQGVATAPCENTTGPAANSTIEFTYAVTYNGIKPNLKLVSKGTTDTLTCVLGTAASSQSSLQ